MTPDKVPLSFLGGIMGMLGWGIIARLSQEDKDFKWKAAILAITTLAAISGFLVKYGIDNILKGQGLLTAQVTPLCAAVAVVKTKQELMTAEQNRLWDRLYNVEKNQALPLFQDRLKALNGVK
jgi:hypothetical protein